MAGFVRDSLLDWNIVIDWVSVVADHEGKNNQFHFTSIVEVCALMSLQTTTQVL